MHKHDITELYSVESFLNFGKNLENAVIRNLDLRWPEINWGEYSFGNTVFMGCRFRDNAVIAGLISKGAHIFPEFEGLPYNPYRSVLYTWQELMQGYGPEKDESLDRRIYDHFLANKKPMLSVIEALAQRIHDHAIDDALEELLIEKEQKVVGIMGGHSARRDDVFYKKTALIARELTLEGYFIVSGGGPGIMEAANMGAYFATYNEKELDDAIAIMKSSPHYSDRDYVSDAFKVVKKYPHGSENLAVPTWFYGHEPSNLFASHIAKYFSNSIREDGLLAISLAGVIFAPGSAGTTQEIFMEATQNHYGSFGYFSPMVFLGRERYKINTFIYPLLEQLSHGREYHEMLFSTDSVRETVDFIKNHPPVKKL